MTTDTLWPGGCIGILGGGQLGRFLAMVARSWGYRVAVWSGGDAQAPGLAMADYAFDGLWDDASCLTAFCKVADVVTYELEHLPLTLARAIDQCRPLRPGVQALEVAQHRVREKQFLQSLGLPTAPFVAVSSLAELETALTQISGPWLIKTATDGYDGKGQRSFKDPEQARQRYLTEGWEGVEAVLESRVHFDREVSLIVARGLDGDIQPYPWIENRHERGILVDSQIPVCGLDPARADVALQQAIRLAEALDLVGLLTLEWFVLPDGQLLVNEIAPRPHNSGHITMEAAHTCQFEQHLRAITGLPLGPSDWRVASATMTNLLGDSWGPEGQPPDWSALFTEHPTARLHLYGKTLPRPGRKMGHWTVVTP